MKTIRFTNISGEKIALAVCMGLALLLLLRVVRVLFWGGFNPDELYNLQVIWLWERGVLPFRDYRYIHLPVHNLLLYPVYALAGPGTHLPGLVRVFLSPVVLLSLCMVGYMGYLVTGKLLGSAVSLILFLASPSIAARLVEMRPDVFAIPLTLGSVILLLEYVKRRQDGGTLPYLSAFLLGLSLVFTLKGILFVPLLLFFFEHYHFHVLRLAFPARLKRTLVWCILLCAPYWMVMGTLVAADMIQAVDFSILTTAGMQVTITPWLQAFKRHTAKTLFLPNTVTIAWGIFAAWRTRVCGGIGINTGRWFFTAAVAVSLVQFIAQPALIPHFLVLPFMFLTVLAASELVKRRPRSIVFWLVLVIFLGHVLDPGYYEYGGMRQMQLEALDFVLSNTDEDTPVLDSGCGFGALFRPIVGEHLYYLPQAYLDDFYFEQHLAVARALKSRQIGAVVCGSPDAYDVPTHVTPKRILSLVEENYPLSEHPWVRLPRRDP